MLANIGQNVAKMRKTSDKLSEKWLIVGRMLAKIDQTWQNLEMWIEFLQCLVNIVQICRMFGRHWPIWFEFGPAFGSRGNVTAAAAQTLRQLWGNFGARRDRRGSSLQDAWQGTVPQLSGEPLLSVPSSASTRPPTSQALRAEAHAPSPRPRARHRVRAPRHDGVPCPPALPPRI